MKTNWEEKVKNHNVRSIIGSIIPFDIALNWAESLDRNEITEKELKERVEKYKSNDKIFSKRLSYKSVGSRSGAHRLMFQNKKAFGDWVFAKNDIRIKGAIYAWNPKTQERLWMNDFEFYILFNQYRIAFFNSQHINVDGTSNPEPFNKPIF